MNKQGTRALAIGGFALGVAALAAGVVWLVRATRAGSLDTDAASGVVRAKVYEPRYRWRNVRGRHWQIISTSFEDPSVTDAREGNRGDCSEGMVEVKGNMVQEPDKNPYTEGRIEAMHLKLCLEWIQKEYPERCARFDREAWLKQLEGLERKPMHFCMDRFEYPNRKGQYPMIYVSWYEATELCQQQGKRLCTEDEWTFACEGEEAWPYPYGNGFVRDPSQCISDAQWTAYNEKAMVPRDGEAAGHEMDRLWKGKASGSQTRCRSPFGVYDMTGNIDEWTTSTREGERPSILKGGYWGPVRTRCRPSTRSHDQNHTFYQQGFRCCTDAGVKLKSDPTGAEAAAPLPRALE